MDAPRRSSTSPLSPNENPSLDAIAAIAAIAKPSLHHPAQASSHFGPSWPSCKCFQPPQWVLEAGSILFCACTSRIPRPSSSSRTQRTRPASGVRHHVHRFKEAGRSRELYRYVGKSQHEDREGGEWTDLGQPLRGKPFAKGKAEGEDINQYVVVFRPSASRPAHTTSSPASEPPASPSPTSSPNLMPPSSPSSHEDWYPSESDPGNATESSGAEEEDSEDDFDESLDALATTHFPPPDLICVSTALILASFGVGVVCFYMILADVARVLGGEPGRRGAGGGGGLG